MVVSVEIVVKDFTKMNYSYQRLDWEIINTHNLEATNFIDAFDNNYFSPESIQGRLANYYYKFNILNQKSKPTIKQKIMRALYFTNSIK